MKVVFVTGNEGKLREVRQLLPCAVEAVKLDLPELQGRDSEVVVAKAKSAVDAARLADGPRFETWLSGSEPTLLLCEDTSLCFDALGGNLPGAFIKWFLQDLGTDRLCKMVDGYAEDGCSRRGAVAKCIFAVVEMGGGRVSSPVLIEGATRGTLVKIPRTGEGKAFGWDSCFQPEGSDLTYAQMSAEEKNAVSHRGKAVAKLSVLLGGVGEAAETD